MENSQQSFFPEMTTIGNPENSGKLSYDAENQSYEISGPERNNPEEKDEFYFAARKTAGDFIFTASVNIQTENGAGSGKIGLMIRQSMESDSSFACIHLNTKGILTLEYRTNQGDLPEVVPFTETGAQYLQLERQGSKILARFAQLEKELSEAREIEIQLETASMVGLAVSTPFQGNKVSGIFSNVRYDVAAASGVNGYETPSASRLEILDTETGNRQVIFSTAGHIEAPNWSRDGKFLIYNSGGKLYKFDLRTNTPELIETGMAINNNNDHGISFDGKTLAISNHTEENSKNNSIIYTLPVDGGEPFRLTEQGPSYWHGWSPDGKHLVYCAERGGDYNVYSIPAQGGQEIQLTHTPGLDDGPEYSPDGKYIYFNSTRTGTMQIWRMKPDGTEQTQITFDSNNDWFAHPSPDGKSIIYISYPPEVPANSHPHNQRVMLRMQSVSGKDVKVMAHIYGGQGTFNVPSWSPDSKKVAFVSYTYGELE